MPVHLLTQTSTLVVKIPASVHIQPLKEKCSVKRSMLRKIAQALNKPDLEIVYSGYKYAFDEDSAAINNPSGPSIIVTINVIESHASAFNFEAPKAVLAKRFKKEIQKNEEHILIDRTEIRNGQPQRTIEIYIKSAPAEKKKSYIPEYSFTPSAQFAIYQSSI